MREFSEPARYVPAVHDLLTDDIVANARDHPAETGYSRRVGSSWVPVTHAELAGQVVDLAAGLMAAGVQPGDRVGILGPTSFEWLVCDYAILYVGAVTVPVYESSSAEQVAWILGDSGAVGCFVATAELAAHVDSVRDQLPGLRATWTMDERGLGALATSGRELDRDAVEARRTSITSDSLATIIYTSGTTGRPKGCIITHANLLCQVRNVLAAPKVTELVFNDSSSTLLYIPVAHILARSIQLCAVHNRVHLAHCGNA